MPKATEAELATCTQHLAQQAACRKELYVAQTELAAQNPLFGDMNEHAKADFNAKCIAHFESVAKDPTARRAECEQKAEQSQELHINVLGEYLELTKACASVTDCTKRAKCETAQIMKMARAMQAADAKRREQDGAPGGR